MRLSTKSRFAVNAMIDLALREQAGPVALAAIANRQQVSLSYLEQLFARLRTAGLVESTRGPGGGYTLGRDMTAISVADIVTAVEIPAGAEDGDGRPSLANDLWHRLDEVMHKHMTGIALSELAAEHKDAGVVVESRPRRSPVAPRPQPRPLSASVPNSVFALGSVLAAGGGRPFGR